MAGVNLTTLGRNTIVAGLAEVWRILSRFILTPLIIAKIGFDGYGAWTVVFSVAAYVSMANASFGIAYTKLTAECVQSEDFDRLSRIVGSGMASIGLLALAALGLVLLWGEWIMRLLLHKDPSLAPDTAVALSLVMVVLVIRMSVGAAHEVLAGLQRTDMMSRMQVIGSLIEFVVSVPLLYLGYGIIGLGIGHLAGFGTSSFIAYAIVRRYEPRIRMSPFLISREGLNVMLRMGGKFQGLTVISTGAAHAARLLITAILGPFWVGVYGLADRLLELGRAASAAVVGPLMPAFADVIARGDRARERLLLLRGSKADLLIGVGSLTFLATFAPYVLLVWTGEDVPDAAWALAVMAVGDGLFMLSSMASANLRARGQVGLEMTAALMSTGVGLILLVPGMIYFGFAGAIWGRVTSQSFAAIWYLRSFLREREVSRRDYLEATGMLRTLALYAIAIAGGWAGSRLVPLPSLGLGPRFDALLSVAVWGAGYGVVWLGGAWRFVLVDEERADMRVLIDKVLRKLRLRR